MGGSASPMIVAMVSCAPAGVAPAAEATALDPRL